MGFFPERKKAGPDFGIIDGGNKPGKGPKSLRIKELRSRSLLPGDIRACLFLAKGRVELKTDIADLFRAGQRGIDLFQQMLLLQMELLHPDRIRDIDPEHRAPDHMGLGLMRDLISHHPGPGLENPMKRQLPAPLPFFEKSGKKAVYPDSFFREGHGGFSGCRIHS